MLIPPAVALHIFNHVPRERDGHQQGILCQRGEAGERLDAVVVQGEVLQLWRLGQLLGEDRTIIIMGAVAVEAQGSGLP